jgi:hypothetical protein
MMCNLMLCSSPAILSGACISLLIEEGYNCLQSWYKFLYRILKEVMMSDLCKIIYQKKCLYFDASNHKNKENQVTRHHEYSCHMALHILIMYLSMLTSGVVSQQSVTGPHIEICTYHFNPRCWFII